MSVGDGLSWAWSKFKDNALILVVGFGVWAILSNLGFDSRVELNGEEYGFSYGIPFWGYVAPVVRLFSAIVAANMSLKVASGRQLEWNDIFSFPNFGASLLASFLTAVATGVGLLLCFIPGIIMAFLLYYSVYFTVDKGVDGIAGMKASWATLSSHVGELFPFALTGVGLYFIGGITLIGWLVTVPLVALLSAYSYVRIQGYDVVRCPHLFRSPPRPASSSRRGADSLRAGGRIRSAKVRPTSINAVVVENDPSHPKDFRASEPHRSRPA